MIEVQFSQKTRSTVQQWQHSTSGDHWSLCSRPGSGSCWWQEYFTNSSRVKKSVPEWSGDHAPLVAGDHAPLVQGWRQCQAAAQLTSNNTANSNYHGDTLHIFVQQTLAACCRRDNYSYYSFCNHWFHLCIFLMQRKSQQKQDCKIL